MSCIFVRSEAFQTTLVEDLYLLVQLTKHNFTLHGHVILLISSFQSNKIKANSSICSLLLARDVSCKNPNESENASRVRSWNILCDNFVVTLPSIKTERK